MGFLYNVSVSVYYFLVLLASPFNSKARLFIKGRRGWKKKLACKVNSKYDKTIWFHCASLGEFEQGRPVIEAVKDKYPECKIALTFFSPSGYEIRKNYKGADIICYLPTDTPANAREFFNMVKPWKAFFIKYEFWHNYITEAKKRGVPLYIVSAIFRQGQWFFKPNIIGRWFRKTLFNVEHFFVQDKKSGQLLSAIGIKNITISGDTRFDRVAEIALSVKPIPLIERFKAGKRLIVAGSTWAPDEELLIKYINKSEGEKFIIAPHVVSAANINRLKNAILKPLSVFSELNIQNAGSSDVLLVDSIGLLSSIYQYGEIAYIGGGFGVGIHNILEAATFGLPVIFGPNYKKFNEAVSLVDLGCAFPVSEYDDLEQNLRKLGANSEILRRLSDLTKKYVIENRGATEVMLSRAFVR